MAVKDEIRSKYVCESLSPPLAAPDHTKNFRQGTGYSEGSLFNKATYLP